MCSSHRLSSLPSDVMCLQVFAHNLFLTRQVFCVCFCDRTLSTVIGWIRNLLRREQKTTDFMPETDEMQMFSPVHCQIFCHESHRAEFIMLTAFHSALRFRRARKWRSTWRMSCSSFVQVWTVRTWTWRCESSEFDSIAPYSNTYNNTSTAPWVCTMRVTSRHGRRV